jgi:hypothetical protein
LASHTLQLTNSREEPPNPKCFHTPNAPNISARFGSRWSRRYWVCIWMGQKPGTLPWWTLTSPVSWMFLPQMRYRIGLEPKCLFMRWFWNSSILISPWATETLDMKIML